MLIPIGQEENEVRRHPWVSYALIGLNILVFLALLPLQPGAEWRQKLDGKWQEMTEYLGERPYLELPAILADRCGESCRLELQEMREQHGKEVGVPIDWVVQEQQKILDGLVQEVQDLLGALPSHRWGYVPARPRLLSLLTSMFLHAGWLHLLGNMLFLYVSGPFLEDRFGRPLFTGLYLASGVVAVLAHAAKNSGSLVPLVGASGAIAGVMGAFLIRLAARRIRFLFMPLFPLPWIRFTFFLPAFVVLPLWFGEQFWYASVSEGGGGVAWWAHIGGFSLGMALAVVVKLGRIEERLIDPGIERKISFTQHPGIERARDLRCRGQYEGARHEIEAALAAEPQNLDAWQEACEVALESRNGAWTAQCALKVLELLAARGERELMASCTADVLDRAPESLPPRFYGSAASQAERAGELGSALLAYRTLAKRHPDDPSVPRALFRSGQILRRIDEPADARHAFDGARTHPACTEELRMAAERALAEMKSGRA